MNEKYFGDEALILLRDNQWHESICEMNNMHEIWNESPGYKKKVVILLEYFIDLLYLAFSQIDLPSTAAFWLFNYLVGFIMYYVRISAEGHNLATARTIYILLQVGLIRFIREESVVNRSSSEL